VDQTIQPSLITPKSTPEIRQLNSDAPYRWLRQGWEDFRSTMLPSLTLGFLFVIAGYALVAASWSTPVLTITFVTGFLLVAPVLSLGFYELSRRREQGETGSFRALLHGWQHHGWSVLLFGLLLGVIMVAWGRLTGLAVALTLPAIGPYSDLLSWQTLSSPGFIGLYFAAGFVLAALVFNISVVAIPMLIDRKVDVLTAALTSMRAVRRNPKVMLHWAVLIALATFAGMALGLLGLLISMPLLGHASWHAYKETIVD
jgi:uncharacterized membrane protein